MTIYEAIGLAWVILTSTFATGMFFYFAWIGFRISLRSKQDMPDFDLLKDFPPHR